jgi:hypothetical protein
VVTLAQRSFAGGELAPALRARVDQARYAQGAKTLRNFEVMKSGGARNRAGLKFVAECKEPGRTVALRSFVFNNDQTYVLEFGHQYLRFHRNGAPIRAAGQSITGVTNANPAVVTYGGTDTYANGDHVYISGVAGAMGPNINGRTFEIANVNLAANTFELTYIQGGNVDSSGWGSYGSGGTVEEVYEVETPYDEEDLQDLQIAQSADVVIVTHPAYEVRKLLRFGDADWKLVMAYFETGFESSDSSSAVTRLKATSYTGTAGAVSYRYLVTAVDALTGEESLPWHFYLLGTTVSSWNTGSDVITTSAVHNLVAGDYVYMEDVQDAATYEPSTSRFAHRREYVVRTTPSTTTLTLSRIDGTPLDITETFSSGGYIYPIAPQALLATASAGMPHTISWPRRDGVATYRIYQYDNTAKAFGIIGEIGQDPTLATQTFTNTGFTPDLTTEPRFKRDPFFGSGNYPAACGYYQQRLFLGGTESSSETIYGSATGYYLNYSVGEPTLDTDPVTFSLVGKQVNAVRHIVDLGTSMVVLTQGGEWAVRGDSSGAILPGSVNAKQYGYNGASTLRPIVIGNICLYVQARGNIVRDLGWNFEADGYSTSDLTIYSTHLFEGYTVRDWAYAQSPNQTVWAVRSDGTALSLTYVREHGILAWARHDTDGDIEQVTVVPEGEEDVPYFAVKRVVDGVTYRHIERMASRYVDEDAVEDMVFLDSAKTYDGWHTGSTTMTLATGAGWTYQDTLTCTASAATFAATDVGKQVHLVGPDGTLIRLSIDGYTSSTVVTGKPHATVPAGMRSTALTEWGLAVATLTGLWHLEGKSVGAFGDGNVFANPNNPAYDTVTVSGGQATFGTHAVVLHVGLPYLSDLETLDIDVAQGETVADKKKIITAVNLHVEKTRGLWVGAADPGDADPTGESAPLKLTELKLRNEEGYNEPADLTTGVVSVNIAGEWNSNGRIFLRQVDPVPCTLLAVMPAGLVPFRG